jgi:23S rRNA pseudouridine2605 synthase
MSDKKKSKSAALKTQGISKPKTMASSGKKPSTKTTKAGIKSKAAITKSRKTKAETVAAPVAKRTPKTRKAVGRKTEPAAKKKMSKVKAKDATVIRIGEPVMDPIGDVSSGEAAAYLGDAELLPQAGADPVETSGAADLAAAEGVGEAEETAGGADSEKYEGEASGAARPPAKLERLQKILSQAGIASRRHAEEMIVAGRVMVNGQVVTTLGSKADPARDHIRVDGKLLQGAERHRYFVLNKPRGYVTTVSDPEGRATVMEFFAGMPERLYPVGRLDYQSEGLLLMTNDGELANLLTKAGSGVEKTYLVKVAGQPSEEELERLRGGVTIERGEEGSERVRTAPARIRPVREGDNPWYEVVLIEGRNRELRKMFSAVGHFVEKIRRVGYGPLVLDVEPGKLRELSLEEVKALRLTAEGKLKPKRLRVDRIPPAEAGRAPEKRAERRGAREDRPRWQRDEQPTKTEGQPRKPEFRGRKDSEFRSGQFRGGAKRGFDKPRGEQFGARPARFGSRPAGSGARPGSDKPRSGRPFPEAKPNYDAKPRFARPAFDAKPKFDAKPRFERPAGRPARFGGQSGPKPGTERRFSGERPAFDAGARFERPAFPARPQSGQSKPRFDRPAIGGQPRRDRAEPRFPAKPRFDEAKRRPFRAPGERPPFNQDGRPEKRFEKSPARSFGARPGKAWAERSRTGAPRTESGKKFAPKGRFEPRGGSKPGEFSKPGGFSKGRNFSKAGGKGSGFRGKSGGGKGKGFRPPGKPGGGVKRG